jgi:hypothetical protein
MKPTNTNPDLLLSDGAPVRCVFTAQADAPVFWEDCETNATNQLTVEEGVAFAEWRLDHPKAIIRTTSFTLRNNYLCDAHRSIINECIEEVQ